jgi:hypothetical protein
MEAQAIKAVKVLESKGMLKHKRAIDMPAFEGMAGMACCCVDCPICTLLKEAREVNK